MSKKNDEHELDWKEESIIEYARLEAQKKAVEKEREGDNDLKEARIGIEIAAVKLSLSEQGYNIKIEGINEDILNVRSKLQTDWDITDKTFECAAGSATIRTTKSLFVSDKSSLIATLIKLDKLPESIRGWDLTILRKLKDVDLIPDKQAYYEERQNVIIRGSSK